MRRHRRLSEIVLPASASAALLWGLQRADLMGDDTNLAVLYGLIFVASAASEVVRALRRTAMRLRVAVLVLGSGAVVYATGWGPVLVIGFMYGVASAVRSFGARAVMPALGLSFLAIALGQTAIELDLAPSVIDDVGLAHGLAALGALGLLFPAWVIHNTAASKEASEAQLVHQAFYDPLSRLPNRTLFLERLGRALHDARSAGASVAVLFVDLDRFKIVNDSLGHEVGDLLLAGVGDRIAACVRPSDTVGRLGGDEFVILLEDVAGSDDAVRVAERIHDELRAPFYLKGYEVVARASTGIALCEPARPVDAERLVRDADVAMYHAKRRGGSRYEQFTEEMGIQALRRLELETRLRHAIDHREFHLAYQPEIALGSGEVVGVEALARWIDPETGEVPLADVIPVAEETGLIVPLGRWVLEEACRQAQEWFAAIPTSKVAMVGVNISTRQFQQPDLVDQVSTTLGMAGIEPRRTRLEITESAVMQEAARGIGLVHELKQLGVQIALDDFGTGHSSLSALSNLPADVIKLDRSFVDRVLEDDMAAIIDAVTTMAHHLDIRVVAEGVETAAQLERLRSLGCDTVQGYLFSPAVLPAEAGALLHGGRFDIDALLRAARRRTWSPHRGGV
ncbi:MAG: EAL domain-containing protein [Actinobacteria bacterium]|nr:EAL domain-containing protein [Actinomycetota bacterium]